MEADLQIYSVYEAKARFSQLLRAVQENVRVIITHHGKEIAELIPRKQADSFETKIADLEKHGLLEPSRCDPADIDFNVGVSRPGALQRFLDDR